VNTRTSSGRVLAFPLPSPHLGGRARLFSGPGLCPGFPLSRAGRQGGRRRANCQESFRKSGRQLFASLTEPAFGYGMKGARFQEPVSMVTHHLAFWDISHSEQGPNLNCESEANTEEKGCTSQEGGTTPTFPIQKQRKKLIQAVRDNSFLIVTGNTGSGKTTQLPKYLYEAGFSQHGMIGVTQPRKVAAISVAQRVAEEMKCTLGSKVGYQVRFDDCSSKETAIKYMTDGCLLKHILGDPNLNKFSVIILDEAHERTLTTDILFGLLKKLFQDKSPNRKEHLKVVIVKVTMDIHLNEMAGDILVFLTDQQRRIFLPPPPGIRKCVISTNISATSLTIDGIRYVVDGGFVKQLNHNPRLGLDILEVVPISKFPYLDPPNERLILEALKQLYQCDAIDRSGHVTRLGLSMVEFPLPPHLTCAVIKAASLDCEDLLLPIAAMLSVENVFIRPVDPEYQKEAEQRHRELAAKAGGFNDFATLAVIFEQCKSSGAPASWCQKHWIHWRCLFSAFRVEAQLRELIRKLKQQSDFPRETFEGPKHEVLRRCLCAGYFKNVARRSVGRTFCTMDGRGSPVHIHPSSALHEQETKLEWIIFHEVLVTTKVYARIVCPIRYEWVRDLLPKLHELNAHDLSSVARHEMREDARRKWTNKENVKQLKDGISKEVLKKMQRRNDDKSISDARARFLERKQQRTQDHSDTLKETG
ncbi:Probable ATP-dependent RNA helicase DHX40, partial [Lemmus lemmus]